ncbi:hypothetical protein Tco_0937691 [Tanacetum coccineum]|uniref:Uncharacterized protein n=1 Tax=Tanacetum coccineum TaxID=301880 RepID=A0ABQ5DEZ8_9ASTR
MKESLSNFMSESAKRHEKNSNLIKEIRASTDAAIRNHGASIKTLEIQIEKMSKLWVSSPRYIDFDWKIHIDCAYNLRFSCMIVVENIDGYRDQDMGDAFFGEPFRAKKKLHVWKQEGSDKDTNLPPLKLEVNESNGKISTIPEKEESSVKEFVPIPSEFEDECEASIYFPSPDDSIPPGIESDDYDSEGDDNSTSIPEFESFHVDYPDLGDSTIDVVEDIPVDVPNILPTHPTLHMDFDLILSHNDLGSDLDVSSPSGDRNKIYDPRICIEVESTRFLATLSPVIDTLLPFSSENEDKVFNHGVLASKENFLFFITSGLYASGFFIMKARIGLIHGP